MEAEHANLMLPTPESGDRTCRSPLTGLRRGFRGDGGAFRVTYGPWNGPGWTISPSRGVRAGSKPGRAESAAVAEGSHRVRLRPRRPLGWGSLPAAARPPPWQAASGRVSRASPRLACATLRWTSQRTPGITRGWRGAPPPRPRTGPRSRRCSRVAGPPAGRAGRLRWPLRWGGSHLALGSASGVASPLIRRTHGGTNGPSRQGLLVL